MPYVVIRCVHISHKQRGGFITNVLVYDDGKEAGTWVSSFEENPSSVLQEHDLCPAHRGWYLTAELMEELNNADYF